MWMACLKTDLERNLVLIRYLYELKINKVGEITKSISNILSLMELDLSL
jgi:hypothetical protein